MRINLKVIEEKLQAFFEEQLHFFADSDPFIRLSKDVLASMESGDSAAGGQNLVPNIFRISIRDQKVFESEDLEIWKNFIMDYLSEAARTNHLNLSGPIHIQFFYNPDIEKEFSIETASSSVSSGKTIPMTTTQNQSENADESAHAYLITPYDTIYPIKKNIINIGRQEENDLVIDNLRVSRVHAQIREVEGRHLLFDLDSTTGTKVNGQRVSQHALSPGDVIDIGDVPLIYNYEVMEENPKDGKNATKAFNLQEDSL